jgi:hypothetical protein
MAIKHFVMPTPACSKCRRTIAPDDINVANDVAYCRDCNISYRLSELTSGGDVSANLDLNHPPKGAWFVSDGAGTVIGATNRSLGTAFGLLFFTLFWNGIVSIFVLCAISGTLHILHVPQPGWFPAPRMNEGDMGVGMVLFLWVFLTPFITIGLFVAGSCLNCLFGRTEVRLNGTQGVVFTGFGSVGWRRRFDPSLVKDVRILQTANSKGQVTFNLLVETSEGRQIKFGSLLSNERRQFFLGALRKTLDR